MTITEPTEKVTRRDLVEGKIEKIIDRTAATPISADIAGVGYRDTMDMFDEAKRIAATGPWLPPWLQGNPGACYGLLKQANNYRISPEALAKWSFVMERNGVQTVGHTSAFFRAIVNLHAPLKERLRHEIIGEGDDRRCKVWGTFKGESEPRVHTGETLGRLRPKKNDRGQIMGSQLWEKKPELQLFYDASRDWARINCDEIIGGMYTREELLDAGYQEVHIGSAHAKDVTPTSSLKLRLGADKPQRAADLREHVNAALDKQQSAASSADETAPAGLTTAGAEEAGARPLTPPTPSASASTTSPPETEGGAAEPKSPKSTFEETGSVGITRPADPPRQGPTEPGQHRAGLPTADLAYLALRDAFDRGVKDRADGKKRSNVPAEWREAHPALAFEWVKGFNSVK